MACNQFDFQFVCNNTEFPLNICSMSFTNNHFPLHNITSGIRKIKVNVNVMEDVQNNPNTNCQTSVANPLCKYCTMYTNKQMEDTIDSDYKCHDLISFLSGLT